MPLCCQMLIFWMHISLKDLLFSACGLSILSTIICTLSTVTCSIHIFSLDLVHLVSTDTAHFTFTRLAFFSPINDKCSAINHTAAHLRTDFVQMLQLVKSFVWWRCVSHSPRPAGPASLSFSQPRMHHSSGRLPDQHHGLWGVCPTHPSAPVLSSWVHLQLWNRRSEVPHLIRIITHHLCTVSNNHTRNYNTKKMIYICVTAQHHLQWLHGEPCSSLPHRLPSSVWGCDGTKSCKPGEDVCVCTCVCFMCDVLCWSFSTLTVKATVFDPHGTELSGERGTSTAFSGEGEKSF